jgi:hypothetical protein
VLGDAIEVGESAPLELGRGNLRSASGAAINHTILRLANLEGVDIDECHEGGIRDEDIGRIHITDHVPSLV